MTWAKCWAVICTRLEKQQSKIAHRLGEKNGNNAQQSSRLEFAIEVLEAVILASVALATVWSGFQAELYGEANLLSVKAVSLNTSDGQDHIYRKMAAVLAQRGWTGWAMSSYPSTY